MSTTRTRVAVSVVGVTVLASCATTGDPSEPASTIGQEASPSGSVVVMTHDSFALPESLIAEFEASTGIDVSFVPVGDAGTLTNQLALTAGAPLGDAVYGIDNTFASRAIASGAIAPFEPVGEVESVDGRLTQIDYSDVCFNIDLASFGPDHPAPVSFDDLLDPAYAGEVSVSDPTTSSPGLALLLATYATYGEGWVDYWRGLRANGVKVTSSWSDGYFVDFSAPNYGGDYPIVLSYASSPPSEVIDGKPTTAALLDTCFRQKEYAGILEGAQNPDGAKAVVTWLLSDAVQSALPESMYVYPAVSTATVPQSWLDYAPLSSNAITLDPETIDAERDGLLRRWTEIMVDGE